MNNVIGERIAKLRKSSGEKQEDLAEVLGCNRGSLANYETGKRTPDIDTIIKIAQHYKTTTDYILGVTDNKTTDTTVQAICDYTGLSENSVNLLRICKNIMYKFREDKDIADAGKMFFETMDHLVDSIAFVKDDFCKMLLKYRTSLQKGIELNSSYLESSDSKDRDDILYYIDEQEKSIKYNRYDLQEEFIKFIENFFYEEISNYSALKKDVSEEKYAEYDKNSKGGSKRDGND